MIAGVFDALSEGSTLMGFVGGTRGLCHGDVQVYQLFTPYCNASLYCTCFHVVVKIDRFSMQTPLLPIAG